MAQSVLHGGHYAETFFDANPPASVFLYMPIIYLNTVFQCGLSQALLYYFYPVILALIFYDYLIINCVITQSQHLHWVYLLTLVLMAFVLSPWVFAERDYLVFFLQLPYVLTQRRYNLRENIPKYLLTLNGLLSAIAISLKPFYLLMPLLLSLRGIVQTRSVRTCLSIENIAMVIFLILYFLIVYQYFQDYWHFARDFATPYYYLALHNSWFDLLTTMSMKYYYGVVLVYPFFRRYSEKRDLTDVFLIAATVSFVANVSQHFLSLYHEFPCFAYTSLILITWLYEFIIIRQMRVLSDMPKLILLLFLFYKGPASLLASSFYQMPIQKTLVSDIDYYDSRFSHKKIYMISAYLLRTFPTLDYTTMEHPTRFAHHWPLLAMARLDRDPSNEKDAQKTIQDRKTITHWVYTDLKTSQPDYIFIENYLGFDYSEDKISDFESVLKTDHDFALLWRQYHYYDTHDGIKIYKREDNFHA